MAKKSIKVLEKAERDYENTEIPRIASDRLFDIFRLNSKKGNVVIIDGLKYRYDGKNRFIIDKNAKKSADAQGKEYRDVIEIPNNHVHIEKMYPLEFLKENTKNVYFFGGKNTREVYEGKERWSRHNKSIEGKVDSQHGAFNDGSGSENYFPLVMYELGDEYIPISNSCVGEIGKIDPNKNPDPTFDMFGAYSNGDRFTVVRPTYSEDIKYDRKKIKCWFVNVRSQKTGKIYRALSG